MLRPLACQQYAMVCILVIPNNLWSYQIGLSSNILFQKYESIFKEFCGQYFRLRYFEFDRFLANIQLYQQWSANSLKYQRMVMDQWFRYECFRAMQKCLQVLWCVAHYFYFDRPNKTNTILSAASGIIQKQAKRIFLFPMPFLENDVELACCALLIWP